MEELQIEAQLLPIVNPEKLLNRFYSYKENEINIILSRNLQQIEELGTAFAMPASSNLINTLERITAMRNQIGSPYTDFLIPYNTLKRWIGVKVSFNPDGVYVSCMDPKNKEILQDFFYTAVTNYFTTGSINDSMNLDFTSVYFTYEKVSRQLLGSNDSGPETIRNLLESIGRDRGYAILYRIEDYNTLLEIPMYQISGKYFMRTTSFTLLSVKQIIEDLDTLVYLVRVFISHISGKSSTDIFDPDNDNPWFYYFDNAVVLCSLHLLTGFAGALTFPGPISPITRYTLPFLDSTFYASKYILCRELHALLVNNNKLKALILDYALSKEDSTEDHVTDPWWVVLYTCSSESLLTASIGFFSGGAKVWFVPGLGFSIAIIEGASSGIVTGLGCYLYYNPSAYDASGGVFTYIPYLFDVVALLALGKKLSPSFSLSTKTYDGTIEFLKKISLILNGTVVVDLTSRVMFDFFITKKAINNIALYTYELCNKSYVFFYDTMKSFLYTDDQSFSNVQEEPLDLIHEESHNEELYIENYL